jgi:hypothetical protein
VRIAHRIRDLQALPYVVVMQDGVAKVYEVRQTVLDQLADRQYAILHRQLYWSAFEKYAQLPSTEQLDVGLTCFRICRFPRIETLEDNERFCSFLRGLLEEQ